MFYEEIYQPKVSDYDRDGKLSYEAVLQILETAGSHHSDSAGDNVIEGSQSGIAWILTDWRVQVIRRTDSKEELHIMTWVRGKVPANTVFRDFILTDNNGIEVIRAEAKFALLDLAAGKLTRISKELFASYQPEDKSVFDTAAPRIRAPAEYDSEQTIILRRSDIDFNGHVHNTKYVDYAMEVQPDEVYKNEIKAFRIVYMKPVKDVSSITLKRTVIETGQFVCVYSTDGLCTMVLLQERLLDVKI